MNYVPYPTIELDETKMEWPLTPDMLSLEELIVQHSRAVASVVDIGTQLLQEKHGETPHLPGWRNRAFRAKRAYEKKAHLYQMLAQERQTAAKLGTKLRVAEIHAARDREQDGLFARHITRGMTAEQRTALWQEVRDAFPGEPCWDAPAVAP